MKFTFDAYERLINLIRKENYVISGYSDYEQYEKVVIIKHDVDMSLEIAAEFAEFEKKLGISTTYNILLCSDFYNPYSKKNMQHIMKIRDLGHEIGLHFDEVRYSEDVIGNINKEIYLLEQYIGEEIKSFSMHRPSQETLKAEYSLKNGKIVNTYSEEFFKGFKYVSDSRHNWREDPIEIIKSGQYAKVHILTHPIWYATEEQKIKDTLQMFVKKASLERYTSLEDNIRDLKSIL